MKKWFSLLLSVVGITMLVGCSDQAKATNYFSEEEIKTLQEKIDAHAQTGTIIAYGGGFDKEDTFAVIRDLAVQRSGKSKPNILYVPTAGRDKVDDDEERVIWFKKIDCTFDFLFVSTESEEAIKTKTEWADIIYVPGGNLKFLTEQWSQKHMNEAVQKAFLRGAVLCGVSSGAMCWAERGYDDCESEVWRITSDFPFFGKDNGYAFYNASGILPFCLCPHYDNIAWRMYSKEAKKSDIPSVCIENGAAIVYQSGKYETLKDKKNRKVYLFDPSRKIVGEDVTENTLLLDLVHASRE